MTKPTRTAKQLQAMIQGRIDAIPELNGRVTDVQLGGVVWAEGGEGRNWTVRTVSDRSLYRIDIARIIHQVQMLYDLEE